MVKIPAPILFVWDKGNIEKNWRKHNVSHKEAEEIFFNKPLKIFADEKHSIEEQRLLAYGTTNKGRKLTLVFTLRDSKIRVISARNQNRKERKVYEKKTKTNS